MKTCAIIPAFNEERDIGDVVRGLRERLDRVIVVDDGSDDQTSTKASEAGAEVLRHNQNRGKGAAIQTGIQSILKSDLDAFFVLDADAQHDWNEVPLFLEKMNQTAAAIVIGNRLGNPTGMPLIRKWTNQFTSWVVSRLCGQTMHDSQCGYRLIRKTVVADVVPLLNRYDAESEFLIQASRAGHRIEEVPIRSIYRGTERSKINPIVDTIRFFKMVWKYRRKK